MTRHLAGEQVKGCDDNANPPVSWDETDFTHHERDIARRARRLTAGYISPEEEELFKRVSAWFTQKFKLLFDKIKSKSRVFKLQLKILKKLILVLFIVPLGTYVYLFVYFFASVLGKRSTWVSFFQPRFVVLLVGEIFFTSALQGLVQVMYMKENLELTHPFCGVDLPGPLCLLTSTPFIFKCDTNHKTLVSILCFIIFPGFLFFLSVLAQGVCGCSTRSSERKRPQPCCFSSCAAGVDRLELQTHQGKSEPVSKQFSG